MECSLWYLVPIKKKFDIVEAEYVVDHSRSQGSHGISQSCRIYPKVDQASHKIHGSGARSWGKSLLHGHGL